MCNFSESSNAGYYPIPHHITANKYVNCNHCNALKLPSKSPRMCCSNGKVLLAEPRVLPFLNHLLSSQDDIAKNFRYKIRAYNSAFAFTSTGIKLDNNLANAQNGLPAENVVNLAMLIHADIPGLNLRTFNALLASQVAAIWIDTEIPSDVTQNCDIVLHTKMNKLIHISEFNACYDPLSYPILFPYSEQGWSPRKIPYRAMSLRVVEPNVDENFHDEENEENDLEYENNNTSISEVFNNEDTTKLEHNDNANNNVISSK
ncbi:8940_t:CDS:2 [Gigaspora margarita]|uniref:8940_t:CDS:1 n=1 Tax=Gigaspora margarita TaxID=4874 RepID=A0ABN7VW58_GIGMA|nr:8940_t:CDS:2 [Gigaspora margarita]